MPVQVRGVIERAQTILQDVLKVRWSESELLWWFNDGRREMAMALPAEFSQRVNLTLAVGTLQTLPADCYRFYRLSANLLDASPRVAGKAVTLVEQRMLDAMNPNWADGVAYPFGKEVLHYTYDEAEPGIFYVFPGNDGTGMVEATISALPADVAGLDVPIGVRDIYANAMVDYLLYRAYAKDTDEPANAQRSSAHYAGFMNAIGGKAATEGAA
jgi:hypothetical protein